jgi:hypothetical protein
MARTAEEKTAQLLGQTCYSIRWDAGRFANEVIHLPGKEQEAILATFLYLVNRYAAKYRSGEWADVEIAQFCEHLDGAAIAYSMGQEDPLFRYV